jgi:hypothetical protein
MSQPDEQILECNNGAVISCSTPCVAPIIVERNEVQNNVMQRTSIHHDLASNSRASFVHKCAFVNHLAYVLQSTSRLDKEVGTERDVPILIGGFVRDLVFQRHIIKSQTDPYLVTNPFAFMSTLSDVDMVCQQVMFCDVLDIDMKTIVNGEPIQTSHFEICRMNDVHASKYGPGVMVSNWIVRTLYHPNAHPCSFKLDIVEKLPEFIQPKLNVNMLAIQIKPNFLDPDVFESDLYVLGHATGHNVEKRTIINLIHKRQAVALLRIRDPYIKNTIRRLFKRFKLGWDIINSNMDQLSNCDSITPFTLRGKLYLAVTRDRNMLPHVIPFYKDYTRVVSSYDTDEDDNGDENNCVEEIVDEGTEDEDTEEEDTWG